MSENLVHGRLLLAMMGGESRQDLRRDRGQGQGHAPRERVVRPGGFNHDGDFFDPAGNLLEQVRSVTTKQAQVLVAEGAAVAVEGCGCGGGPGGCELQWIGTDALGQMGSIRPRFVRGFGSPTWIDLWQGEAGFVVCVHGDVQWGDPW